MTRTKNLFDCACVFMVIKHRIIRGVIIVRYNTVCFDSVTINELLFDVLSLKQRCKQG